MHDTTPALPAHTALAEITQLEKEPGDIAVYFSGMPNDDYHKAPGVSHSQSKDLVECPELFYENHVGPNPQEWETTPSKVKGSALHTLSLEGRQAFKRQYVYEEVFAGVGSKALRTEWKEANKGRVQLKEEYRDDVEGMARRLLRSKEFKALGNGEQRIEEAFFVRNEASCGELIKAKFDILNGPLGVAGDVKSSGTGASMEDFARAVAKFGYASQAAWYLQVLQAFPEFQGVNEFLFFVVSSSAPYLGATYRLKSHDLDTARGAVRDRLLTLSSCRASGVWPGYNNNELTDLEFTPWESKKLAL